MCSVLLAAERRKPSKLKRNQTLKPYGQAYVMIIILHIVGSVQFMVILIENNLATVLDRNVAFNKTSS